MRLEDAVRERALSVWALLTARQRETVRLKALGFPNAEIGEALGVSPKSIDNRIEAVRKKAGVSGLVGLTHLAIAAGQIDVDPWEVG